VSKYRSDERDRAGFDREYVSQRRRKGLAPSSGRCELTHEQIGIEQKDNERNLNRSFEVRLPWRVHALNLAARPSVVDHFESTGYSDSSFASSSATAFISFENVRQIVKSVLPAFGGL